MLTISLFFAASSSGSASTGAGVRSPVSAVMALQPKCARPYSDSEYTDTGAGRPVLLLHGDGRWTLGPVATALTTQTLSDLYLTPMLELGENGRRVFVTQ